MHSFINSGLIAGGKDTKEERQTVFFTAVGFLVGNFCDPAEGSLNSRTKTFSDGDTYRAAALLAAFLRAAEIALDGAIYTLSRIDRLFINLPMAELRDVRCHSRCLAQHPLFISAVAEEDQNIYDADPFVSVVRRKKNTKTCQSHEWYSTRPSGKCSRMQYTESI